MPQTETGGRASWTTAAPLGVGIDQFAFKGEDTKHALVYTAKRFNSWLGWGDEGMSERYNRKKLTWRSAREVANARGVGFNVPSKLGSIEPIEPKIESATKEKVAVNA